MGIQTASWFSGILVAAALVGCGSSGDNGGGPGGPTEDSGASSHVDSGGGHASDAGFAADASAGADTGSAGEMDSGALHDSGGGHADSGAGADASGGTDSGGAFVPAPHPPFPKLVNSGGSVLTTPKVVGVFFSNYDHIAEVDAMLQGLPTVKLPNGESFWSSAVGEYGVGPLTVLPSIKLTTAAPTTSPNVASFVQSEIQSNAAFASVDTDTIVAVFYPSTTPLSGSCAAQSLGFGGYHESTSTSKGTIPYAVSVECANFAPSGTTLDMVTIAGSHEIIEAATDPFPSNSPAYASLDNNGWAMDVLLQGNEENGDMCTINDGFGRPSTQFPYLLQRGWSNEAAAAGNLDPCQPSIDPGQPFVGAYPVMPDMVSVQGASGTGPGVQIAVGQSKTIEVDCFTFEPTPAFTVGARQSRAISPPELTFAWDSTACQNGDKRKLTITVSSQGKGGYEAFLLYTELPGTTDTQKPAWAGIVTP